MSIPGICPNFVAVGALSLFILWIIFRRDSQPYPSRWHNVDFAGPVAGDLLIACLTLLESLRRNPPRRLPIGIYWEFRVYDSHRAATKPYLPESLDLRNDVHDILFVCKGEIHGKEREIFQAIDPATSEPTDKLSSRLLLNSLS